MNALGQRTSVETDGKAFASVGYEYDLFGYLVATSGDRDDFAHRFSTKPQDEEAGKGMRYYGDRYYEPLTGRWPSLDPIEEQGGFNLYAFIGNDGMNKWDILGQQLNQLPDVPPGTKVD